MIEGLDFRMTPAISMDRKQSVRVVLLQLRGSIPK